MKTYADLAKINVNSFIEKKNGLSYLSWAWAVDALLREDPTATWTYAEPVKYGDSLMVFCTVQAFGKSMTAQLPVMDHRNKAIANPDAFAVNTAMQRCLAKAISLHGIGLYIYAGEDLPLDAGNEPESQVPDIPVQWHEWVCPSGSVAGKTLGEVAQMAEGDKILLKMKKFYDGKGDETVVGLISTALLEWKPQSAA